MINFYLYQKNGFGFTRSFEMAFEVHPLEVLFNIVLVIAATALLIYTANGILEGLEYEAKQKAAYTRNLEKTLAKCMTPGDHPITLEDGTLILCGAAHAGRHGRI